MPKPLRIGVLGLTHDHVWGELKHLAGLDDARLVAVADPNQPLLDKATQAHGCATHNSYDALLEKESLDAVFVASDNRTGAELIAKAAERGLAVMVEKPLAATYDGARRAVAAVEKAGVPLVVSWPFAWWPGLLHAIDLARDGEIGDVFQVKYRAAHQGPRELGCSEYFYGWLYDAKLNGAGALMDYCCYGSVLAATLLGQPTQVTGFADRFVKDHEVDDNAVILMRYADATAIAEASWSQMDKLTAYVPYFYGTKGTLIAGNKTLTLADAETPRGRSIDIPDPPAHMQSASAHFLHVLQTGEAPHALCGLANNLIAQQILQAGLDASRTGHTVTLGEAAPV
ncbi:MAG: Gfo/Idh/MocA family oxidoreductase [Phycisphaeraceae bacterium]